MGSLSLSSRRLTLSSEYWAGGQHVQIPALGFWSQEGQTLRPAFQTTKLPAPHPWLWHL